MAHKLGLAIDLWLYAENPKIFWLLLQPSLMQISHCKFKGSII